MLALSLLVSLLPLVHAHGSLSAISVDGISYAGPEPGKGGKPAASVIRRVDTVEPLKGTDNPSLACGSNAVNAKLHADANPGSNITVSWLGGGGQVWPHKVGPVMTYLAACTGTPDCSTFDASTAEWFKIDQLGLQDASTGKWWHEEFFNNRSLAFSLPDDLQTGFYLMRNEIVALHLANERGGVEFYPACAQLNVSAAPETARAASVQAQAPNGTVSFPGAYAEDDAGILDADIFNTPTSYVFPGGAVSNVRSAGDQGGAKDLTAPSTEPASGFKQVVVGNGNGNGTTNGTATSAASIGDGASTSASCKTKRRVRSRFFRYFADESIMH